jgi:hypothetical protein
MHSAMHSIPASAQTFLAIAARGKKYLISAFRGVNFFSFLYSFFFYLSECIEIIY